MRTRIKENIIRSVGGGSSNKGIWTYYNHPCSGARQGPFVDDHTNLPLALTPIHYDVSIMIDELGKRPRTAYCKHMKEVTKVDSYRTSHYQYASSNGHYDVNSTNPDCWLGYAPADVFPNAKISPDSQKLPGVSKVLWSDIPDQQCVQELYNRAVRPVADMLLNYVELEQVRRLPSSFGNYSLLKKSWNRMNLVVESLISKSDRRAARRFGYTVESVSKQTLKKISDLHLASSFGLAPLISDISSITKGWSKIGEDYNRIKQNPRMRQTIVSNGSITVDPQLVTAPGPYVYTTTHSPIEATRRYVLLYDYVLPSIMNESFRKMAFYLNRMSTGPGSILWESVPWSFVIDWVFDLKSLLYSIDSLMGADVVKTVSLSRSQKIRTNSTKTCKFYSNCSSREFLWEGSGSSEYSLYERVGLTRSTYVGLSHRFGLKQALLSLSLLYQKLI